MDNRTENVTFKSERSEWKMSGLVTCEAQNFMDRNFLSEHFLYFAEINPEKWKCLDQWEKRIPNWNGMQNKNRTKQKNLPIKSPTREFSFNTSNTTPRLWFMKPTISPHYRTTTSTRIPVTNIQVYSKPLRPVEKKKENPVA